MMIGRLKLKGFAWGKVAETRLHFIGDWRCTMAPGGAREDPVPPLKGVKEMRRLITKVVDRVHVGDASGDTLFNLFDDGGIINMLKGVSGFG